MILESLSSLKTVVFVLKNWKLIVSSLAALTVGFGAAWFIQGVRVDMKEAGLQKKKVEITAIKKDLLDCQDANKTNQETIGKLKDEVAQADRLCAARLKINSRKAGKIRQIEELKPYVPQADIKKDGGKDEKANSIVTGDALLNELDGLFNEPAAGGKDGIHKATDTGAARETAVLSCQMAASGHTEAVRLYCLDAENVKNLLKNRELDKAYSDEMRTILEGLR
jgi:hypothetical protein